MHILAMVERTINKSRFSQKNTENHIALWLATLKSWIYPNFYPLSSFRRIGTGSNKITM